MCILVLAVKTMIYRVTEMPGYIAKTVAIYGCVFELEHSLK